MTKHIEKNLAQQLPGSINAVVLYDKTHDQSYLTHCILGNFSYGETFLQSLPCIAFYRW